MSPTLPQLPVANWPAGINRAYNAISDAYNHGRELLHMEDTPSLRYALAIERMKGISTTVEAVRGTGVAPEWTNVLQQACNELITELVHAEEQTRNLDMGRITIPNPVVIVHTGQRGRPSKHIDPEFLNEAFQPGRNISISHVARLLKVHRNTVRKSLQTYGIQKVYSDISDNELDDIVHDYVRERPDSGLQYMRGHIRALGLRVQRDRVISSMRRVNPIGPAVRGAEPIERRIYHVTRPNSVWHMDGYLKLGPYGMVLHGVIDGYCRTMVSLQASTTNNSRTVYSFFQRAAHHYGWPSRVRGDRGGENKRVAIAMIRHWGKNRGSYLWGSSTRNTRIERIWVEVGRQFARRWKAFFFILEEYYFLQIENPHHLWLLAVLFLDEVNSDCQLFQREWNHHGLKTMQSRSPNDQRFLRVYQDGVWKGPNGEDNEEWEDEPASVLQAYLEVDRQDPPSDSDSDSHSSDSSIEDLTDFEDTVDSDASQSSSTTGSSSQSSHSSPTPHQRVKAQIRHRTIATARIRCPFPDQQAEHMFHQVLTTMSEQQILPPGFGLLPGEEGYGEYNPEVRIPVGGTRAKWTHVTLPRDRWEPRLKLWAQAVTTIMRLVDEMEPDK